MKKIDFKEIIEITCCLYVFFFLTFYGTGKILDGQSYTEARIVDKIALMPIGLVPDFELAWTFMVRFCVKKKNEHGKERSFTFVQYDNIYCYPSVINDISPKNMGEIMFFCGLSTEC